MTLTLAAASTIQGVAGSATAITYSVFGDEITAGPVNTFKKLAQGQLAASAGVIYTVPGSTSTIVKDVQLVNTTGAGVAVTMYVDGTAAANSIGTFTVPANGQAIWSSNGGWSLRDANGSTVSSSALLVNSVDNTILADMPAATFKMRALGAGTGDPIDGTATQAKTALAIANTDVSGLGTLATISNLTGADVTSVGAATTLTSVGTAGTKGSASAVPVFVTDAKGRVTSNTDTPIAITSGQVSGLNAMATTNLTGDVTSVGAATTFGTIATARAIANVSGSTAAPTATPITPAASTSLVGSGRQILTTAPLNIGGGSGGDLTGDRTIAITANGITNAFLAQMPTLTIKGNNTGGTANAADLTATQVKTLLAIANTDVSGLGTLATVSNLAGDVTSVGAATTLPAVGPGVTTVGDATHVAQVTTDVKGRITALTSVAIAAGVPTTRNINTTAPITGGGDLSADRTIALATNGVTNALLAQMPTLTVKGNNTGGTANAADLTVAQLNAMGIGGGLTGWVDVTKFPSTPVLPGNTAAQNITAINAILAASGAGSTIYIPQGIYQFNAAWTMPAGKQFNFQGQGTGGTGGNTLLEWTANVGGHIITLPTGIWYWTFRDLNFCVANGITQSAGALININGNAGTHFYNCTFTSVFGGFWNDILYGDTPGAFPANQSWNSAQITNCQMSGYKGRAIFVDSALASLVVNNNCVVNGQWGSASVANFALAGIQANNCGALQINDCDFLGNINNMLLSPAVSQVNASVFCTNTYFDNSGGSCIKIAGAGATVRARFDTCSFTTAGASSGLTTAPTALSAVELASTFATYPVGGQGIDFVNCNVLNTFGTTGVTNGFLISNTADFSIGNCRIAGWSGGNGINVTPMTTSGRTQMQISNNTIGPAGGYGANNVGILLNAGIANYGSMVIESNFLEGNTTAPMTDNSIIGVGSTKKINGNPGYIGGNGALTLTSSAGGAIINGRGAATSGTALTALFGTKIPANAVSIGQVFRIEADIQASAAAVFVIDIHAGAAGTTADTVIATLTGTAVLNGYMAFMGWVEIAALGASNTVAGQSVTTNGTAVINKTAAAEALSSVPTTAAWFITVSASMASGTATVKGALIEAL